MAQAVIPKDNLAKAIAIANKAVASTPIVPLLSNVLFRVGDGTSRIVGTNIELGVSCEFEASGDTFEICVPAKTLSELINATYSDEVTVTMDETEQAIIIETENSKARVKCILSEEFPPVPRVTTPHVIMPVMQFKEMVNRVAFAAHTDKQSNLSGVLLATQPPDEDQKVKEKEKKSKLKVKGNFVMFATNGYHFSFEKTRLFTGAVCTEMQVIIKADVLELANRILPSDGLLMIEFSSNKVMFQCGEIDIVTQVMGVDFPNYELVAAVVPNEETARTTIIVPTLELLRACKKLKVFAADTKKTKMEAGSILLNFSIETQTRGGGNVEIVVMHKGDPVVFCINVEYLSDFLEVCKSMQTVIRLKDNKSPIKLSMEGFEDYWHVIMPIAL